MSLNVQFYLLVHTILYGVFLGLTFDSLNLGIQRIKKRLLSDFLIVLYWLVQLPLAIWFFHKVNHGQFQTYLLIFALLGGLIYYKMLQKKYHQDLKILLKHTKLLYKGIKKVTNIIIFSPLLFIFRIIFDIIVLPKKFFMRIRFRKVTHEDEKEYAISDGNTTVASD